jgi:putative tryptophan/tyrosine transport system substrate-binding protein
MRRREFISLVSAATIGWFQAARAQQPALPVIGFLNPTMPETVADRLRQFHRGLRETGYVGGENVAIEYRWAEGENDRLPELAAELVRRPVSVIAAFAPPAVFAAKAATTAIPIVFIATEDPVRLGLVSSLARPGGNATGINIFTREVAAKRLELLRELLPATTRVAVLVNPTDAENAETTMKEVAVAARAFGLQIQVLNASSSRDIDAAFVALMREKPDALFLGGDPFFTSRRVQLANLAARHVLPLISGTREIADVGGLMSYGSNIPEAWRQVGVYVGRILRGTKPADLPVVQATKIELVINAQTARMLGVTVPPSLLARADEVIE